MKKYFRVIDNLKTGDGDSKKPREDRSGTCTDEGDIFEKSVESAKCRKDLFNCLKNLEQKMNLDILANSNKKCKLKVTNSLLI